MAYVLVLGATSDIGRPLAHEYARAGYDLYLAARTPAALEEFAEGLHRETGRAVRLLPFDALRMGEHREFFQRLDPPPEGVICLVGLLGPPPGEDPGPEGVRRILETNLVGCASILEIAARTFEARRHGFLVGVSSVAGDRGRASNYVYGSAKAGLSAYLSGLRGRLHSAGVQVLTVKPGFVRTRMTAGMRLPPLLTAEPEEVARGIFRAQQAGKDVVYLRRIWRPLMWVVRAIPEWLFKRLEL